MVLQVRKSLECLSLACEEVLVSKDLDLLLSASLKLSNILDTGTRNADGSGIRLPSMLKLADVKASDKRTSLLKVILGQLERTRGIDTLSFLVRDMPHLRAAASVQVGSGL